MSAASAVLDTSLNGCLSVVMPCFNEQATVARVCKRVLDSPFCGELIVVDDGSSDDTVVIVESLADPRIRLVRQPHNRGKGAAIRRGLSLVTRPFVVIQDADLEYDPADWAEMLGPLASGAADVVYGSRFAGGASHRVLYYWHSVGNRFLTTVSNMLTNLNLTDMETCYKMFRREVVHSLVIEEDRFGMEPEITAKIAAAGWRVFEVGISYDGRTYDEGKKIGWKDGVRAMYCMLVRYAPWWSGLRRRRARKLAIVRTETEAELLDSLDSLDDATNYASWIHDQIAPHLGSSVIEVGAGHGTFTRILAEHRDVIALEPSPLSIERLRTAVEDHPRVTVVEGDLSHLPPDVEADSAIFVNVLEHIADDHDALRSVGRALGAGGIVVVLAPALELLYSRFDAAVGHHRRYRRSELTALFDQCGYDVVSCRYVNAPGALAWLLYAKLLRQTPTRSGPALTYDRVVVPLIRRLEARWEPPVGQSLLCVARVRDNDVADLPIVLPEAQPRTITVTPSS